MKLTALTREQLQALDATASVISLSPEQLMERAGMELAAWIEEKTDKNKNVLFVCGTGNNGGDGLVACRHLYNRGYNTSVLLIRKDLKEKLLQSNLRVLEHMNIPVMTPERGIPFSPFDVIVDCILGYGQKGEPRDDLVEIIKNINRSGKEIFACDIPTGIDATTGKVAKNHVKAKATLSFAAPKKAFEEEEAREACGEITIVGIGIPKIVYEQMGLKKGSYLVEGKKNLS